jgi:FkbM family methyltransferase
VVAIDFGANFGVHTIEWAKGITRWGSVLAIGAQERVYYALAGNIAINNCFNAVALHAAVSDKPSVMMISSGLFGASSFWQLELRKTQNTFIDQPIDYSEARLVAVRAVGIDSPNLPRIDFIKIDIEGMQMEALSGAAESIARSKPVLLIESINANATTLREWLSARDYQIFRFGTNSLPSITPIRFGRASNKYATPMSVCALIGNCLLDSDLYGTLRQPIPGARFQQSTGWPQLGSRQLTCHNNARIRLSAKGN